MSAGILIGLATERAGLHHHNVTRLDLEIFPSGVNLEPAGGLVSRRSRVITECLLGHCRFFTIGFSEGYPEESGYESVSYTHLTLPTILRV